MTRSTCLLLAFAALSLAALSLAWAAPLSARAACAHEPDDTPRCWVSEDEHMPQLDKGQVELTTAMHVPHDYDPSACKLVATWSGSEKGATPAAAPDTVTDETDAHVAHWRIHFPLAAADAAVRIEQAVTCPGGTKLDATARALAADGAARRVCGAPKPRAIEPAIQVGDTELTVSPAANVVWRAHGTQWLDQCSGTQILDTASLRGGTVRSFVPDAQIALTLGEQMLAVRATGVAATLTDDELVSELPMAIVGFDHELTAADIKALRAALAPAAGTLVIHGDHPRPRPR